MRRHIACIVTAGVQTRVRWPKGDSETEFKTSFSSTLPCCASENLFHMKFLWYLNLAINNIRVIENLEVLGPCNAHRP